MLFVRSRLVASVLAAICLLAVGCSTTSKQLESSGDEALTAADSGVDSEVARYMLGGRVPLVAKFRMKPVQDELGPVAHKLLSAISSGSLHVGAMRADKELSHLLEFGPLEIVGKELPRGEWVDQIDRDRPWYVSREVLADDSFTPALVYGAVFQPEQVAPFAIHTRLLLPTKAPAKLAASMQKAAGAADADALTAITAAERFVVVDVAQVRGGVDPDALPPWKASGVDTAAKSRHTPARQRFIASDAAVAVYLRAEEFRRYAASVGIFEAQRALEMASPEYEQRILAAGGDAALGSLLIAPGSERESEDAVVELRADDNGGVVLDATSTLTERGRAIARAAGDARTLHPPSLGADASTAANLWWNFDLVSVMQNTPVRSKTVHQAQHLRVGPDSPGDLNRMYHQSGWRGYAETFFISPTLALRSTVASMPDRRVPLMPEAGSLELSWGGAAKPPSPRNLDAAAGVLFADARIEKLMTPLLDRVAAWATNRLGIRPSFGFADVGQDAHRLDVRAGSAAETTTTRKLELPAASASARVDLAPILTMLRQPKIAESLGELSTLRVKFQTGPQVARWRAHLGAGELAEPTIETVEGFEAQPVGPLCPDILARTSALMFRYMAMMRPTSSGEKLLAYISDYDAVAKQCADEAPELADQLRLARARMRGMLRMRLKGGPDSEGANMLRQSACELGDQIQCADQASGE